MTVDSLFGYILYFKTLLFRRSQKLFVVYLNHKDIPEPSIVWNKCFAPDILTAMSTFAIKCKKAKGVKSADKQF